MISTYIAFKSVPQRLKPRNALEIYGTAEAVPFVLRLFPVRHG
jgi:hypothetical protein